MSLPRTRGSFWGDVKYSFQNDVAFGSPNAYARLEALGGIARQERYAQDLIALVPTLAKIEPPNAESES